jgi:hypothetical protein
LGVPWQVAGKAKQTYMSLQQPFKPSISHAELKRKAMQTFFFDDEDLRFNRDGRLSDKQKQRLTTTTKAGVIVFVLSGLLLSAMFVWTWEDPLDQLPWIIPAFMTVSFTLMGLYAYRLGNKVVKLGVVEYVAGKARFKDWQGKMFLQIHGRYFRPNKKFREIFVPDIWYKIYYAPSDNTIISVEILD